MTMDSFVGFPSFLLAESENQTRLFASLLGSLIQPGQIVGLDGPLGAGKTCFVKGLAQGLGIPAAVSLSSPSFALVQSYAQGRSPLHHADLYRLETHLGNQSVLQELGLFELAQDGVLVVEWLSLFAAAAPLDCLWITLEFVSNPDGRRLTVRPGGPVSLALAQRWMVLCHNALPFETR